MAEGPVKKDAFAISRFLLPWSVTNRSSIPRPGLNILSPVPAHSDTLPITIAGLISPEERTRALRVDYRDMGVMIFGDAPRFESVLETLAGLEQELNSLAK